MISAALWSTLASSEGSASRGATDTSPEPHPSSISEARRPRSASPSKSYPLVPMTSAAQGRYSPMWSSPIAGRTPRRLVISRTSGSVESDAIVRRLNSGMRSVPSVASRIDRNQVKWFEPAAWTTRSARFRPSSCAQSSIWPATLWHKPIVWTVVWRLTARQTRFAGFV